MKKINETVINDDMAVIPLELYRLVELARSGNINVQERVFLVNFIEGKLNYCAREVERMRKLMDDLRLEAAKD